MYKTSPSKKNQYSAIPVVDGVEDETNTITGEYYSFGKFVGHRLNWHGNPDAIYNVYYVQDGTWMKIATEIKPRRAK